MDRFAHLQSAAAIRHQPEQQSNLRACPRILHARILTSNINYAVSPSLSFSNLIPVTIGRANLGWQSRVRWTLRPGNDVFVAFNQGWIHEEDLNDRSRHFRPQGQQVSAKFHRIASDSSSHRQTTLTLLEAGGTDLS